MDVDSAGVSTDRRFWQSRLGFYVLQGLGFDAWPFSLESR